MEDQPRKNYRASVEAGLHRLEQEKLSFLDASSVISKFDEENLEAYAPVPDSDDDETTIDDHVIVPSGAFDMMRTLSDVQQVDSEALIESARTLETADLPPDMPTIDLGDEDESEYISDVNTIVSTNDFKRVLLERRDAGSSAEVARIRPRETRLVTVEKSDTLSSQDVSQYAEQALWDNAETNDLGRDADRVRAVLSLGADDDLDGIPPSDSGRHAVQVHPTDDDLDGETHDVGRHAERVRTALSLGTDDDLDGETHDVGRHAERIRAALAAESDDDHGDETHDVGRHAERIRAALAAESDDDTHDVGRHAERMRASLFQGCEAEDEEDEDDTLNAGDLLDYAQTTDLGHQAELVRKALAQNDSGLPPMAAPIPIVPKPGAQVLKPAQSRPETPLPTPVGAMDKLKQQGVFEPMIAHAEVSDNIRNIQGIDALLPQATIQPWTNEMDSGDETIPHEKPVIESANRKDSGAPKDVLGEIDLESRETIPISLTNDVMKELNDCSMHRAKTQPLRQQRSVQMPIKAQTVLIETKKKGHNLGWVVAFLVVFAALGTVLYFSGVFGWISPELVPHRQTQAVITSAPVVYNQAAVRAAVEEASEKVDAAVDFDSWLESWLETRVNLQTTPEGKMPYLELAMQAYPDNPRHPQRYIEACIEAGQSDIARDTLRQLPEDIRKNEALRDLNFRIWTTDAHFIRPTATLDEDMCDTISPLGGGSTLTFKCELQGEIVAAFKPLQTRKQSNYRSEIAAWRLCELIECDFSIPWNRPVRIERNLFNRLYNRSKSSKKEAYRKELVDLTWTKDSDGSFVYGTLKDWVPNFTRFPIEYKSFWQPWLSQAHYISEFKPLREALAPLSRNGNTAKLLGPLMEQSPDLTTKQLAAQVSEVLVFDFLVGNWDRFSGVPEWWGVNCQYKDNKIVSIDNGAAFPTYSNDKVYERYMMAERFSRHFIDALRNLDKDQTFKMLFPSPSKHETESFEQFWHQRNQVLNRVDSLCEKYGADRVLSL